MIAFVRRYFARRRLWPVVGALPRRLAKGWGRRECYTVPQVRRAISDLRFNKSLERYALAAACALQDVNAVPMSADEHQALRTELADLFELATDFTIKDLLLTRQFGSHIPAEDQVIASGGPPD